MKHGSLTLESFHKVEDTQTFTSYKVRPTKEKGLWQEHSLQTDFYEAVNRDQDQNHSGLGHHHLAMSFEV